MSQRLLLAARLALTIQWRSGFPQIYFGIAIFIVLVLRSLIPADLHAIVLPAFFLAEPGSLGIFMVAAQRYLERGERSVVALAVTPLTSGEYVSALILSAAVAPAAATAVIQAGVQGPDARVALIIPPIYLLAIVSGGIGLMLSTVFTDFTRFILGSIPPIAVYSLPLLTFYGLAPVWAFKWVPSDPAVTIFAMLASDDVSGPQYALQLGLLGIFAAASWWAAIAVYASRVRREIEFA